MVAISSMLAVIAVSLLITRIATVILTATGMSREAARFQARSAFTGAGFTTSESEAVVDHPVRRRVIGVLMLLGSAGIVVVISTLIIGLERGADGGHRWWRVIELVLGLIALVLVSRSRWVDRRLTRVISRILRDHTQLPGRDLAGLLDLAGGYAVSELAIGEDDWVAGRSLSDLGLRDEGVVILGLTRAGGRYLAAPTGDTVVRSGDTLVVYGDGDQLCELDGRPAGEPGDAAHRAAVTRQEGVERSEQAADA